TLTFTKKAANEMKERIFYGLKNHYAGKDIKGKSELPAQFPHIGEIKARARNASENFDKTHIQTLDSYFSEIAKKGARFYGITPNFTLDDEKITSEINYKATKYVLEHLKDDEIKQIAKIFDIQNVPSELFAASMLEYSTVLTPIDFVESLEKQKKIIIEDFDKYTRLLKDEISSLIINLNSNRPKKPSPGLKKLYDFVDEIGNPVSPKLTGEVLEKGDASFIAAYLKKVTGYCASDFSRVTQESYKTAKKAMLPILEKVYLIANSVSAFNLQAKIFRHLEIFQNEVNRAKRREGILSFADVSQIAFASLAEQGEIRHIEQQKFDSIMIDEFQDDNQLQCDVLLILSDKNEKYNADGNYVIPRLSDEDLLSRLDSHKLFFVGDDKQSIYRFRGADVSVFRSLSASIKNSIELKTNYRSSPELIRGFNTIFGGYDYPWGEKVNDENQAVFMTKAKFPDLTDGSPRIPDYEADYKRVEVPSFKLKACDFSEKKITVALYPTAE
ncbi:MAG: UvrD-helicase domain-containing protein, partial [Treponema sp.]|nr:UvrD-helicase domain-containing protein [Treponema sp.]